MPQPSLCSVLFLYLANSCPFPQNFFFTNSSKQESHLMNTAEWNTSGTCHRIILGLFQSHLAGANNQYHFDVMYTELKLVKSQGEQKWETTQLSSFSLKFPAALLWYHWCMYSLKIWRWRWLNCIAIKANHSSNRHVNKRYEKKLYRCYSNQSETT